MRRSVYANYPAFIRTSKEITDLEGELSSIRNLLSTQATLIHGLAAGVHIDSLPTTVPDGSAGNDLSNDEDMEPSDLEKWLIEYPDLLDVLLAERRVDEALASLDGGECVASEAKDKKTLTPNLLMSLEHWQTLGNQLAEAARQPSTCGGELRAAISALKRLGDGPRAHSLLLMHTIKDISTTCRAFVHQALHMEEHILQLFHSWCSLLLLRQLVIPGLFLVRSELIAPSL
ncbi:hypothetical protein LguiB_027298 [Lonicera macranthoides]